MKRATQRQFQEALQSLNIPTEFLVVKPNWVSNDPEGHTDAETLRWLFESVRPDQRIIILESYTPWRGLACPGINAKENIGVDLVSGKAHWDFYQRQDEYFLHETGIGRVLHDYQARYLNITNEYWNQHCCHPTAIAEELQRRSFDITFEEFCSYIPTQIYDIRDRATFVSLTKIKLETEILPIRISLSLKNVFGLIPHPARMNPYHGVNHQSTPMAIADINKVYAALFRESVWINDGMRSVIHHYCTGHERIEQNTGLLFVGRDPIQVDSQACQTYAIDPKDVPYLQLLHGVWKG